jgi:stearoyl-CoA desaturase (Delta-9 desaturase)
MASSSSDVKVPVAQAETFPDGTTDHVPLRKRTYDIRKPHITDQPITLANWYQHVNWLNTLFIVLVPMVGLISSYWVNLQVKTAVFAVVYYYFAGLGISKSTSWSRDMTNSK